MQGWAGSYMHWRRKRGVSKGEYPLGSGFPIGASSTPVGTRLSLGKSSVLYLCFRLTPGRGWLRHLRLGQMGSGQTLFGVSRTGGFCTVTDEIGICSQGKIRLPGKGSKAHQLPPRRSYIALVSLPPPWVSRGSCSHYTDAYTGHCKNRRWIDCPRTPSGSSCTGKAIGLCPLA